MLLSMSTIVPDIKRKPASLSTARTAEEDQAPRIARAERRVGEAVSTVNREMEEIVDHQNVIPTPNETELQMVVRPEIAMWPLLDE